ncbi:MAG TPA: flagellar filament capping protein FliD [Nocardioides sp.]
MSSTTSVSGLSGFDSAGIVDKLMQLEAVSQTRLKTRVSSETSVVSSLQTLNSRLASLKTRADDQTTAGAWSALTATSSVPTVTIAADTTAVAGAFGFTVQSVALGHRLGFATAAASTDVVTGASTTVRLDRLDGTTVDLETGDGTLAGLAAAINDPANATGLRATTVKVAEGSYRLLVESTATGAASDFTLTAADGSALLGGASVRAGVDAAIDLGSGIVATSPTNTFTDLTPGVDITLGVTTTVGAHVDVTLATDTSGRAGAMKALVDTVNAALSDIDTLTSYNATTKKSGALAGDPTVRSLRNQLLTAIYPTDGTSLASLGVQVDRNGKLTFDEAAFSTAYAADPEGVTAALAGTNGFVGRIAVVADTASNSTSGTLTQAITGRNAGIQRLNDSIDQWDLRLEMRRTALTRQFTALETALTTMQAQSSWLESQISSLSPSS